MNKAVKLAPETGDAVDFEAIKAKQNATWSAGDYASIGATLQIVGENLAEAMDLRGGHSVLDVAAGNGNFTLAAARRHGDVTSTDYVGDLLDFGAARAEACGLTVNFEIADAENLPYENHAFDAIGSTFGVMFAPNHVRAASELSRVCRPGGKIGMANWTPDGFVGNMFKTVGQYNPPPAGVKSPAFWGTEDYLDELFGAIASDLSIQERAFVFRYRSPEHWMEIFENAFGPIVKTMGILDDAGKAALRTDLIDLIGRFNTATDGTMVVPGAYLEVVITKK